MQNNKEVADDEAAAVCRVLAARHRCKQCGNTRPECAAEEDQREIFRHFHRLRFCVQQCGGQFCKPAAEDTGCIFSGNIPENRWAGQCEPEESAFGFIEPCAGIRKCADQRNTHAVEVTVEAAASEDEILDQHSRCKGQRADRSAQIADETVHTVTSQQKELCYATIITEFFASSIQQELNKM